MAKVVACAQREMMSKKLGLEREASIFKESEGVPTSYMVLCNRAMKEITHNVVAKPVLVQSTFIYGDGGIKRKRKASSSYKCRHCNSRDVFWTTQQTRSGDEPSKIIITCEDCQGVTTINP